MRTGTFLLLDGNWTGAAATFNVTGVVTLTSDVGTTIEDGDSFDDSIITKYFALSANYEYTMNDGTVFTPSNAAGSAMIIELADGRKLFSLGNSSYPSSSDEIAANGSGVATVAIPAGINTISNTTPDYYLGSDPICFTRGTLIKTDQGEVAIEELAAGDMVLTMDHGYQPIRWIGSSKRAAKGDLAPILIRKGALGNDRDLRVSPQHRMLLQGWQAEMLFGEVEVLATAKSLLNDHSILRDEGGAVEYFHMLFDTHEIIYAEGCPSESFHPGKQGWKALDQATRDEILTLFPQLADGNFNDYGPAARVSLKHKEGKLLGSYMAGSV